MPELSLHCPHCHVEKAGFSFGGLHPEIRDSYIHSPKCFVQVWTTLFACRLCAEGVVVKLPLEGPLPLSREHLERYEGDPTRPGGAFEVENVYPEDRGPEAPRHVPEGIARPFRSAKRCLNARQYTAAGLMFRKALERAAAALCDNGGPPDRGLAGRIESLADRGILVPAMKELAHLIRLGGNEAAHDDEEFDELRAGQLAEFTHFFLMFAFTLPELLRRARGEAE